MAAEATLPAPPDEQVEPGVVVREGEYGARVIAVEPGGVGYIAEVERHGAPMQLFWTWNSPNWEFATMYAGVLPVVVFGGGFWPTLVAMVLGSALGALPLAIFSTWGPKFGVPQMVQSRGAFGFWGNILPAGLSAISAGVGWFAVNTIAGTFALGTFTHLSFQVCLLFVVVAQVAVAFIGHNFIHAFEKWVFPVLAIIFTLATVIILTQSNPGQGFNPSAPVPFGGPVGAFSLALFIAYSYAASWATYAMDYSRYLPKPASKRAIFWAAGLGLFISCVVPEIGGVALATVAGTAWGPTDSPTDQLIKPLGSLLGSLALLAVALGAISANVLNIYSGALGFLALGVKLGNLRQQRAIVALIFGVIGYVVSRLGEVDAGHSYENFLLVIGYWETPFIGVVVVDYLLRRGRYHEAELFARDTLHWRSVVAMLVGIVASVPFWNQSLYVGPVARANPQLGDLGFLVGFLVAAAAQYLLGRGRIPAPAVATKAARA